MRKFMSHILATTLLFSVMVVNAQGYTFRVLANKGNNQVQKAGTAEAVQLKTGATLNANDVLISSEGAYIGLMHKTGKTTEVRGAGKKKVSDIESQIQVGGTSVADRYAQFVMSKMNESENTNYRSRLNATGAVSRATGSAAISLIKPPSKELNPVLGDKVTVRWVADSSKNISTYKVVIKNFFSEPLLEMETEKTFVELDLSSPELAYDAGLYLINVYNSEDEEIASEELGVEVLKEGKKADIRAKLTELKAEISEDSPLNKLIYASFYEENGLLMEALAKYEEAIKMSPEVDDFQVLYSDFIERNGMGE